MAVCSAQFGRDGHLPRSIFQSSGHTAFNPLEGGVCTTYAPGDQNNPMIANRQRG
jgi:hypothetical protein